jgi:addiction module RelB/DinJ family antitoxin
MISIFLIDKNTTNYILCSMKTVMSVKIEKDVKASAQEVAKSAGLSLSSLVNAYLRQVVATRRIEFYAPEPMTPKLEKFIAQVEKEISAGNTVGPFATADEFLRALHSK